MTSLLSRPAIDAHRRKLRSLDTEYLVGVWYLGSIEEWTPEGLEAVAELLGERLGSLPPRRADNTVSGQAAIDTYHDHDAALNWSFRLHSASWLPLAVAILSMISLVPTAIWLVGNLLLGNPFSQIEFALGLLVPIGIAVMCFSLFLVLRALAQGLLVLLDTEDNTRKKAAAP